MDLQSVAGEVIGQFIDGHVLVDDGRAAVLAYPSSVRVAVGAFQLCA
jgi:hypothetical protein